MIRRTLQALGLAATLALLGAGVAHAGIFRAYLSLTGSDANPCTLPQPCRLLPAALAAANDGGEIWMLDSANYNVAPVTIDKGIKILAIPGEMGSIVGNGGDALVINAPNKDVTLRNLVILNLANGLHGVNIVDAGAVHIEKTTIHDFTDTNAACVRYNNTTSTRIFIDDSFLRHCGVAVRATASALPAGNLPSVIIDNTRIERGFAISPPATAIWMQGCLDVTVRNSTLGRNDNGIVVDSLVASCGADLQIVNSTLTRITNVMQVNNATSGATLDVRIHHSQLTNLGQGIAVNQGGNSSSINLEIADSLLSSIGDIGLNLQNTATDAVGGINVNIARSNVVRTSNVAVNMNAPNGSRVRMWARDVTFGLGGTFLKTAGGGASVVQASLIRSNMNAATTAIDHGFGQVRIDGCHFVNLTNSFVNNGSGNIVSLGNNWLSNATNTTPGFTYITPTLLAPI